MDPRETTEREPTTAQADDDATVPAFVPLALLQAMTDHDRPEEVLEDEDLTVSLPRRLGLSDVVYLQIQRYEQARRRGRSVPARELQDLLGLVIRRPDAQDVLERAGAELARRFAALGRERRTRMARRLPGRLGRRSLRRAAARLLRRFSMDGAVRVSRDHDAVELDHPLTARVDADGVACRFCTTALDELAGLYTRLDLRAEHDRCIARGDEACSWSFVG